MDLEMLLSKIKEYDEGNADIAYRAYRYALVLHEEQYRQSGEPYIIYALNVAYILVEMHADIDTVCAGLLHDALEDTNIRKEDITPIDFAYKIHTDMENTMVYTIVNDKYIPVDYVLNNKNRVRIITDILSYGYRNEWYDMAKTSYVRKRIKEFGCDVG